MSSAACCITLVSDFDTIVSDNVVSSTNLWTVTCTLRSLISVRKTLVDNQVFSGLLGSYRLYCYSKLINSAVKLIQFFHFCCFLIKLDLLEMSLSMWCKGALLSFAVAGFWWSWLHKCHRVWLSFGTILWMFC